MDTIWAQTDAAKPAYQMFNNTNMKPKRGHEKMFEEAVKAHNALFHATAPNQARLSVITDGAGSDGWYVWSHGPMTYSDMDHRPSGEKKHDDDWEKNVDIHVEAYGESTIWKLKDDLSYTPKDYNPAHLDVWRVDIKPGMRFEFGELMKKIKTLHETKKYPFSSRVFYNEMFDADGADAAVVYGFNKYADFDMDLKYREDFDAIHGAGAYDNFWKKWSECVVGTEEHFRKFIK